MKQKIFSICAAAIILLACTALLFSSDGNYAVYILAYVFSFAFLLCYTVFTDSSILEKIAQGLIYALIMAAQIVFDVLVLRDFLESNDETSRLGKLIGILIIFIPFLIQKFVCKIGRNKTATASGEETNERRG